MSGEKLLIVAQFEVSLEGSADNVAKDDVFAAFEKCRDNILKSIVVKSALLRVEEI